MEMSYINDSLWLKSDNTDDSFESVDFNEMDELIRKGFAIQAPMIHSSTESFTAKKLN